MSRPYFPIILTSNNVVSNTNNSTYQYTFNNGLNLTESSRIAVGSIQVFYSWYNISSTLNNNVFQLIWPTSTTPITKTITINNGFYSIEQLNAYLEAYLVSQGLYLVNSLGQYVYYVEFTTNPTTYSVQINSYPIPTSLPAGYTNPASITFPVVASTPQITILSTNSFSSNIGFTAGTYPTVVQATIYSAISNITPQITPIQTILVNSDLVQNVYSLNPSIIDSFSPAIASNSFGSLINYVPASINWSPTKSGNYYSLKIWFSDQYSNPINILDNNITIKLYLQV